MTDDQELELTEALKTSPDFLSALDFAHQQVDKGDVSSFQFGLFFFVQGYLSCLDYMDKKDKLRSFKYEPPCN